MFSALTKLIESLPPPSDVIFSEDPDRQARAAFALFVQAAATLKGPLEQKVEDPSSCPNCDKSLADSSGPYCSPDCREQAGFVRRLRRRLEDGSAFDETCQVALGQVMWHVLGGGYPRRNKMVLEKVQAKLLASACVNCGAPAVTFDHRGSACNRTSNLEPLCKECATTREFGDPEFLARPEVSEMLEDLAMRVGSQLPVRSCDNPESWDWRAFVRRRKDLARNVRLVPTQSD